MKTIFLEYLSWIGLYLVWLNNEYLIAGIREYQSIPIGVYRKFRRHRRVPVEPRSQRSRSAGLRTQREPGFECKRLHKWLSGRRRRPKWFRAFESWRARHNFPYWLELCRLRDGRKHPRGSRRPGPQLHRLKRTRRPRKHHLSWLFR